MRRFALGVLFFLLVGSGWTGTAVASFTPTETPTVTPTATISATYTITPTFTHSPTPAIIALVRLNHNRFNPAQGEAVEILGLRPDHGDITVAIYNAAGIRLRKFTVQAPYGTPPPAWDGKNEQGQTVASGVYYFVLQGNRLHKRLRIAVIK